MKKIIAILPLIILMLSGIRSVELLSLESEIQTFENLVESESSEWFLDTSTQTRRSGQVLRVPFITSSDCSKLLLYFNEPIKEGCVGVHAKLYIWFRKLLI